MTGSVLGEAHTDARGDSRRRTEMEGNQGLSTEGSNHFVGKVIHFSKEPECKEIKARLLNPLLLALGIDVGPSVLTSPIDIKVK